MNMNAVTTASRGARGGPSWLRLSILSALCASSLLGAAAPATAGTYTVRECWPTYADPAHVGIDAGFANTSGTYLAGNDCATGDNGGVQIGIQPITYSIPAAASWTWTAPSGAYFSGMTAQASLAGSNGSTGGNGHIASLSMYAPSGAFAGGWTTTYGQDFQHVTSGAPFTPIATSPISTIASSLSCIPNCVFTGANTWARIKQLDFSVVDTTPPPAPLVGGQLAAAGVRHGTETLSIDATDAGGGVQYATVSVNGAEVARPQSNCAFPAGSSIATQLRPCPNAHFDVPVNTETAPWHDGANTLLVCATDVSTSGPGQTTCQAQSVQVDNSCRGSSGPKATAMSAGLGQRNQLADSVEVDSTDGVPVRGILSSGSGPVAGANVCVYQQVDAPGQPRQLATLLTSRSGGDFDGMLPPGPTRDLEVVYRYSNAVIEKASLHIDSHVAPELKLRPRKLHNGDTLKFSGSIPGPNNGRRAVTLQAKVGNQWRTFKQLKTKDDGAFKGEYRFKATTGTIRYTFRVLVKPQNGYPYLRGVSAKRKAVVRG